MTGWHEVASKLPRKDQRVIVQWDNGYAAVARLVAGVWMDDTGRACQTPIRWVEMPE